MTNGNPVYCPFYVTENDRSITCEGLIGIKSQSVFPKMSDKTKHKKEYCLVSNCQECKMYKALMEKYERSKQ